MPASENSALHGEQNTCASDSIASAPTAFRLLQNNLARQIIGQQRLLERLLIGLLANGHLLVEGLPGLAKTRAIKCLAGALDVTLSRIQFTPDLLPADITGSDMYYQRDGEGEFRFDPGPVFANLVLADEINRAPAKVQAALLEAMEERQVTVAGKTHALPAVFLVMATQNPIEQEGTYPLPEAQMDRFLMHVRVDYPSAEDEVRIVQLVRAEAAGTQAESAPAAAVKVSHCMTAQEVLAGRAAVASVHCASAIDTYMVDLVQATRQPARYSAQLAEWLQFGASPRGAIGLDRAARAHAWLQGRDFVTPDDVRGVAHDVLRHRLVMSYEASAMDISADRAIDELLRQVAAI